MSKNDKNATFFQSVWQSSRWLFLLMFCLPTVVISIVCYSLCCMEPIDDENADEFDEDEDEDGYLLENRDDLPPGSILTQTF